jgi:hypothetical protein
MSSTWLSMSRFAVKIQILHEDSIRNLEISLDRTNFNSVLTHFRCDLVETDIIFPSKQIFCNIRN